MQNCTEITFFLFYGSQSHISFIVVLYMYVLILTLINKGLGVFSKYFVIVFVSVFALVLYFPQLLNVFFLADLNICSETGEGAGAGCRSWPVLVGSDSEMPDLRTPPTLPTNARLIFRRHVKGGGKQGRGGARGAR